MTQAEFWKWVDGLPIREHHESNALAQTCTCHHWCGQERCTAVRDSEEIIKPEFIHVYHDLTHFADDRTEADAWAAMQSTMAEAVKDLRRFDLYWRVKPETDVVNDFTTGRAVLREYMRFSFRDAK